MTNITPIFFGDNGTIGYTIDTDTLDSVTSIVESEDVKTLANEIITKMDKVGKEIMEKEKKITEEGISNRLYDDCCRLSNGNFLVRIDFVSAALKASKWINYAGRYMVCKDTPLIYNANKMEREFVNGLSVIAGFGKIYEDNDIMDLDKCDSAKVSSSYTGKLLFNKDETLDILFNEKFQSAMRKRMIDSGISSTELAVVDNIETVNVSNNDQNADSTTVEENKHRVDDEGYIHPIFTTESFKADMMKKYNDPKPDTMPAFEYSKFKEELKCFLGAYENRYRFDYINGYFYLYILRDNGIEDFYILDDGSIMGGRAVSVLANYHDFSDGLNKTIFVNSNNHPVLIRKILSSSLYFLTPEEVEEVKKDHFYDTTLYNMIDFSDYEGNEDLMEFMDWLTPEARYTLETNLLGIRSITKDTRFKFTSFNNESDFTLESLDDIVAMFPLIQNPGENGYLIRKGMKVTLKDKDIAIDDGNEVKTFRME